MYSQICRCFFGEFLRRWDPSQPILDGLPLRVQLLDEHRQLLLALLTGVGIDALECLVPSGQVGE